MGFCPCFGDEISEQAPLADRDPVLLVSGMGGSILHSKPKKFGLTTRVWVRIFLADLEFRKKIWSLYNPKTGYTETLDKKSDIVVPDDDHGLYAIDILDPSWFVKCVHLTEVYHFHDMIDMLVGCGYVKGTTLFGYGYDFRQSNRMDKLMDGLKLKLETAYKASGGRKVNIISHSMGGVMILCFMSLCRDAFSKYVNKWIALACPFQGAPGCINDSLLTGLEFVEGLESYFFVSRWTFHQLVHSCSWLICLLLSELNVGINDNTFTNKNLQYPFKSIYHCLGSGQSSSFILSLRTSWMWTRLESFGTSGYGLHTRRNNTLRSSHFNNPFEISNQVIEGSTSMNFLGACDSDPLLSADHVLMFLRYKAWSPFNSFL